MRTIILAAGQGYKMGNFNKLLLRNPQTNQTILDSYLDIFAGTEITIVVGYKAVNIMNQYPHLNYIYNPKWHLTKDSYSLALALNDEPCFVIHSDLFISNNIKAILEKSGENSAVTINRDDRTSDAINCTLANDKIQMVYQGELLSPEDPELIGLYKVTQHEALRYWKRNCLEHRDLHIGQNFPFSKNFPLYQINGNIMDIRIIKTPLDYINFLNDLN